MLPDPKTTANCYQKHAVPSIVIDLLKLPDLRSDIASPATTSTSTTLSTVRDHYVTESSVRQARLHSPSSQTTDEHAAVFLHWSDLIAQVGTDSSDDLYQFENREKSKAILFRSDCQPNQGAARSLYTEENLKSSSRLLLRRRKQCREPGAVARMKCRSTRGHRCTSW